MILDYVPFTGFYVFSLVGSSFAEILTFNRRYLVLRAILKEYPSLLKDDSFSNVESLWSLANEKSPSDDSSFSKAIYNDMINYLLEKKRYAENLWKIIPQERIMEMDQSTFIVPFRGSMMKKTFYHFPDIPETLRMDRNFILKFFTSHSRAPLFFQFLCNTLRNDEEIAKMAVCCNGLLIKYVTNPSRELVNLAYQCKRRFTIYENHYFKTKLFRKERNSFFTIGMNGKYYELLENRSLIADYRKSLDDTFFRNAINLDKERKTIEFLLLFSYFEKSREFKYVFIEYYLNYSKNDNYIHVDDLITDIFCYPEKFTDFLSIQFKVPEELKCKTREITISQMLQRLLKDNFTFDTVLANQRMKLTSKTIEYLRDRLIKQLKVTPLFSRHYFKKYIEKRVESDDENEKFKLLNEISHCRELNLKMLKYHPKYYGQLIEEFRNDDAFKVIAMNAMKTNAQYFDFSNDEMLVLALSSNLKRSVKYLRKNNDRKLLSERILRIFTDENGRIQSKWLTWPNVYRLFKYFLNYLIKYETLFTFDDRLTMMDHVPMRNMIELYHANPDFLNENVFKKFRMKNQIEIYTTSPQLLTLQFMYCITYMHRRSIYLAHNGILFNYQKSDQLLSKVLRTVPKFIKVFFTVPTNNRYTSTIPGIPFELLSELALENPAIIHYLPKDIQRKLKELIFK